MNKKLLVLLPIAMLALAGCNNPAEGGGQGGGGQGGGGEGGGGVTPEADIVINHDTLADHLEDKYSYPQNDYEFLAGGIKFEATAGVGHKTANSGTTADGEAKGNYYNEQKALQFRKEGHANGAGVITVANAIAVSKITVHWFATYETEETKYHPVVRVGDSHDAISTNVACNEGATVTGVATGGKEVGKDNKNHDVYLHTTSYTVSGHSFFHISAPGGALYVKDIVIAK